MEARSRMVVGVTGGIATGKTSVCLIFKRLGAIVIDADQIGKEIVKDDKRILSELVAAFGRDILTGNGCLDRRKLGKIVFAHPEARRKLNQILHPPLLKRLHTAIELAREKDPDGIIVVDAALIVEWGIVSWFDALVVVVSSRRDQIERLVKKGGLTFREAEERVDSQLPTREKVLRAHYVIPNDRDLSVLRKRSVTTWRLLLTKSRSSSIRNA